MQQKTNWAQGGGALGGERSDRVCRKFKQRKGESSSLEGLSFFALGRMRRGSFVMRRPRSTRARDCTPALNNDPAAKADELLRGLRSFGGRVEGLLLGGELRTELLDAAGFNDAGLGTRVEGVAGRGGIELEERVRHAVDFNRFARLNGGRDDEGLVDRKVNEGNGTVLGVDIRLHFERCS